MTIVVATPREPRRVIYDLVPSNQNYPIKLYSKRLVVDVSASLRSSANSMRVLGGDTLLLATALFLATSPVQSRADSVDVRSSESVRLS
jgi:hypothetical protein